MEVNRGSCQLASHAQTLVRGQGELSTACQLMGGIEPGLPSDNGRLTIRVPASRSGCTNRQAATT